MSTPEIRSLAHNLDQILHLASSLDTQLKAENNDYSHIFVCTTLFQGVAFERKPDQDSIWSKLGLARLGRILNPNRFYSLDSSFNQINQLLKTLEGKDLNAALAYLHTQNKDKQITNAQEIVSKFRTDLGKILQHAVSHRARVDDAIKKLWLPQAPQQTQPLTASIKPTPAPKAPERKESIPQSTPATIEPTIAATQEPEPQVETPPMSRPPTPPPPPPKRQAPPVVTQQQPTTTPSAGAPPPPPPPPQLRQRPAQQSPTNAPGGPPVPPPPPPANRKAAPRAETPPQEQPEQQPKAQAPAQPEKRGGNMMGELQQKLANRGQAAQTDETTRVAAPTGTASPVTKLAVGATFTKDLKDRLKNSLKEKIQALDEPAQTRFFEKIGEMKRALESKKVGIDKAIPLSTLLSLGKVQSKEVDQETLALLKEVMKETALALKPEKIELAVWQKTVDESLTTGVEKQREPFAWEYPHPNLQSFLQLEIILNPDIRGLVGLKAARPQVAPPTRAPAAGPVNLAEEAAKRRAAMLARQQPQPPGPPPPVPPRTAAPETLSSDEQQTPPVPPRRAIPENPPSDQKPPTPPPRTVT